MNFPIHLKFYCLVMKFTILLIVALTLNASADVLGQKVTLRVKDAPLRSVLQELRKQSGYSFVYKSGFLHAAKPVSVSVDDREFAEVLPLVFDGQPFDFIIEEDLVTLIAKTRSVTVEPIGTRTVVSARSDIEVRGRVVDSLGNPLQGATVRVLD